MATELTRAKKGSAAQVEAELRALDEAEARVRAMQNRVAAAREIDATHGDQLATAEALRDSTGALIQHTEAKLALGQLEEQMAALKKQGGAEPQLEKLAGRQKELEARVLGEEAFDAASRKAEAAYGEIRRREEQDRLQQEATRIASELDKANKQRARAEQAATQAAKDHDAAQQVTRDLERRLEELQDRLHGASPTA